MTAQRYKIVRQVGERLSSFYSNRLDSAESKNRQQTLGHEKYGAFNSRPSHQVTNQRQYTMEPHSHSNTRCWTPSAQAYDYEAAYDRNAYHDTRARDSSLSFMKKQRSNSNYFNPSRAMIKANYENTAYL